MSELSRMITGQLYNPTDPTLVMGRKQARRLCRLYNNSFAEEEDFMGTDKASAAAGLEPSESRQGQLEPDRRERLLAELFGAQPDDWHLEPDFKCDYGFNIKLGRNFFANYDCQILDVCPVIIGDNVMLGPRVGIYTAAHPLDAETRNQMVEFGLPVTLGNNIWVGGGAIILPGVTIGDDTVIGAGAVVTKDLPAGVLAVGNPCRILRQITEVDKDHWQRLKAEYDSADDR